MKICLYLDECVLYQGKNSTYIKSDDCVLAGLHQQKIDQIIEDLRKAKLDNKSWGQPTRFSGSKY